MDPIMTIAREHGLIVIEDCAHALGAAYRGQPVGSIGDAGFFSLQTLKPLNTYGGGVAVARDPAVMSRVAAEVAALPLPRLADLKRKLFIGRVQRIAIRPRTFSVTLFPLLWAASWTHSDPGVYLWESIRPLTPPPPDYRVRYTNAQAALGLAALDHLDNWTANSQANAACLDVRLAAEPCIITPRRPSGRTHVYYQYCAYVPDRDAVVRAAIRRGVDIETLHVDVCTDLPLFAGSPRDETPGAHRAASVVQLPMYASLSPREIDRVAAVVTAATRSLVIPQLQPREQ
jgi:dTDP-4-amino-4,6-dideoxygalactose transaminase